MDQLKLYYKELKKNSEKIELFLEFLNDGLTFGELRQLLEKRPDFYSCLAIFNKEGAGDQEIIKDYLKRGSN